MADYSGSFSGSFQGTISGSLLGSGIVSSSAQLSVDWNGTVITNKPTTISPFQANSIVSNNRFRENTFPAHSASVSTRLTSLEAGGGSVPAGTVSSSTQITNVITNAYISASAAASGFGSGGGETYTAGLGISISGNVITLDTSSTHFRLGVSGAASSYGFGSGGGSFGDPPVIDQSGLQIREYTGSGVFVGTLTVTDPTPGDTATWATQSGYSAGYFGISTGGNVTTLSNPTASWNTTAGSGSNNAHPFLVQVTDGQNNTTTGTIYIYVLPNNAPQFRSGSISGNVITSYTSSYIAEASTISTVGINDIYVTDVEGDTIFIGSGSWITGNSSHFAVSRTGSYIRFLTNTSSLDYDTYPYYEMVLTASDAKYVDNGGSDLDSISYLYVRINVADNTAPFVTPAQSFSVNESGSDGRQVGLVSIVNPDDATGTIVSFQIYSSSKSPGNTNLSGSFTGTSLYDPTDDPFTTSGNYVVVKAGAKLNYDLVDTYVYNVGVRDSFDPQTNYETITINILDHATSSIGVNNGTYYILETALQGTDITSASNGYSSGSVTFTSSTSQIWNVNTVPSGYVRFTNGNTYQTASSVTLEVGSDISASLVYGQSVVVQITASQTSFETTKQYRTHTLSITENKAFSASFADTSSNLNTNGARPSNNLTTLSFTELQSGIGDTLNHNTFTFISSSANITASRSGDKYLVYAKSNLSAGSYTFTASIADNHGKIGSGSHSITIVQAGTGSLTTNGTFYVIESAVSGAFIYTSTNGRTGTQGDLGVTYSPQYNSAAVQAFTSSNAMIHVTNAGALSIAQNVSGSAYTYDAGTPIVSTIYWQDQYGNIGTGSISVNVAINNAPVITFTNASSTVLNTNAARSASNPTLSTITFTDAESNALNHDTFTLTDPSGQLSASRVGDTWYVKPITNLSASVYQMTASIKDVHGFRVGSQTNTFDIIKANIGSFSAPSLYIIESALSGAGVTTESDGSGSAYTLSVSYSPNYGSQIATNFSASGDGGYVFVHPTSGVVTIYKTLSGSAVQNGSSLTPLITWNDQYGNLGSQSLSVGVVDNQAATATFTDLTANWVGNPVSSGVGLVSASILDPEVQIVSMSLSGTDAGSLVAVPQTFNSSSYVIKSATTLTPATYYYSASIHDNYGNVTSYPRSIVVTAPALNALVYVYNIGASQNGGGMPTDFLYTLGYSAATTTNPSTLSTATTYPSVGFANALETNMGAASFNYSWASAHTATLLASASLSSMTDISSSIGYIAKTDAHRIAICIPSGSPITDVPTSMDNGYGVAVNGRYVLEYAVDSGAIGAGLGTSVISYIHKITLDSAVNGYSDYIIISNANPVASSTNILLDIRPNDSQP